MFKILSDAGGSTITVLIDGRPYQAPRGCTAAAAALLAGETTTRTTPVSGEPRAPYCMMGVCFECLMEIDGVPNQQACLVPITEGMRINRQHGKAEVQP